MACKPERAAGSNPLNKRIVRIDIFRGRRVRVARREREAVLVTALPWLQPTAAIIRSGLPEFIRANP